MSADLPSDAELISEMRERAAPSPGDNYVNEGHAATHEYGVCYQGEFETPSDGTGTAVRIHARALAAQGVPVLLKSFSNAVINDDGFLDPVYAVGLPPEVSAEVGHLVQTSIRNMAPVIKHAVVRGAEHLRQLIIPRSTLALGRNIEEIIELKDTIYKNTILYTVWERDRLDTEIVKHLKQVAEVWVPSTHNAQMLKSQGVENVQVMPHPFDPQDPILRFTQRAPRADGWRRYYSIGRWEPRKGFHELIGAFMMAFKPGDKASLVIKYTGNGNWKDYLSPEQSVAHWLSVKSSLPEFPNPEWTAETVAQHITLIGERLKRSRILELHFRNDTYVSASHGEAWGIPAFEAKLAGNRMIFVPYGGPSDFEDPTRDMQVPFELGPVHSSYGWEHDAKWADYDVRALAKVMKLAQPLQSFRRPGEFDETFGFEAIGKRMLERVNLIAAKRGVTYGSTTAQP